MSYNISRCYYAEGTGPLYIKRKDAIDFVDEHDLAEVNFLERLPLRSGLDPEEMLPIGKPSWSGEFSGRLFDTYKELLALTKGTADIILIWEGGDHTDGICVENGKVTPIKAVIKLEPK